MNMFALLAYLGAIPFVLCAALPLFDIQAVEPFGRLDQIVASYGLAIVSFLCGSQWATQLHCGRVIRMNLFVVSNVVLLGVWIPFLTLSNEAVLMSQIAALALLWFVDRSLHLANALPADYLRARSIATGLAVAALLVVLLHPS